MYVNTETKKKIRSLYSSFIPNRWWGAFENQILFFLPNKMMIFVAPYLKFNPQNQPKYSTFVMFSSGRD